MDRMTLFPFTLVRKGEIENSTGQIDMGKIPGHSQLVISLKYISDIIASFLCTLPLAAASLIAEKMVINRDSELTQSRASMFDDCLPSLPRVRSTESGSLMRTGSANRPAVIHYGCPGNFNAISFSTLLECLKLVELIGTYQ
jgi:hypothetical protein